MDFNQKIFKAVNPSGPSKMNTTKWQFLLAIVLCIDGGEIALEYLTDFFFGIGHIVVMVAEMIIAPSLFFFLWFENVHMTFPRVMSIFSVFFGEEAGGDDFAPLWSGDVAFLWWADSKDKLLDKMGVAGNIARQAVDQQNNEEEGWQEGERGYQQIDQQKNGQEDQEADEEENGDDQESKNRDETNDAKSSDTESSDESGENPSAERPFENDNIVDLRGRSGQNQEELREAA